MKKILLLLAKGYETYEASVFIDVMGWNLVDGDGSTKLFSCGMTREVRTSFDQRCLADFTIEEVDVSEFDALVIPGGFEEYGFYEEAYSEKFSAIIREFYRQKKIIASVCVGALALGWSGILTGKKATTYNKGESRQEMLRKFGAQVIREPVVIDGNIMTCWNPSTAMTVAFEVLERLTSKDNARAVREMMGFDNQE